MTLVFQPGYSPEFNSIESLWHVIKSRVKAQLILANEVRFNQEKFQLLVEKCCDSITYEEALRQHGANRNFLRSQLLEMKKQQLMDEDLQQLLDSALVVEPDVGQEGPLDVQSVASQPVNVQSRL